jgi:Glycosyl hydrolases family 28
VRTPLSLPGRVIRAATALIVVVTATAFMTATAHAAAVAPTNLYPKASIYPSSTEFRLTVNGRTVPVQKYPGYDIAQFAMGTGDATLTVTKINNTAIGAYTISPRKLAIQGSVSGPTLTFTVHDDAYLIVKVDGRPNLVIAIDPTETDRPPSSGNGIFNIGNAPYSVAPGDDYDAAFQTALDDASAWGSTNGGQGTVYVRAGVYVVTNLYLRSNVALYLEAGAVLRYSGVRSHYAVLGHKDSQDRDLTWLVSTRYNSSNIRIYGRGILDGNGAASLQAGNLGVHLLVPIYTTGLRVDGITFRESSTWAIIPSRSSDLQFRNIKIFNRFDMGENDGIDVMESRNVTVTHAIGIALDDPFSTKTWSSTLDLLRQVGGNPQKLADVTFDDLVTWTYCYGVKVGQGVVQDQDNITIRNVVVYDAAVALGVHHKYGTAAARTILFENIDVETLSYTNDNNRTWLALWTDEQGIGPVQGVTVSNVRLRNVGTTPARINGQPGALITGVTLNRVFVHDSTTPATTLAQMNVTNVSNAGPIAVTS